MSGEWGVRSREWGDEGDWGIANAQCPISLDIAPINSSAAV